MMKRLEKLLLIPLALSLTACPEKFELKDLDIKKIIKIKCEVIGYKFPDEGKKWDVTFNVWYDVSKEKPDYKQWYSRRKSLAKASEDCDNFFKYLRFPR